MTWFLAAVFFRLQGCSPQSVSEMRLADWSVYEKIPGSDFFVVKLKRAARAELISGKSSIVILRL